MKEESNKNDNRKCADFNKIKEYFSKQDIFISLNFARVYNDNDNLENPLKVEFVNYYKRLDMRLNTYDSCKFNYFVLKDEMDFQIEDEGTKKLSYKECESSSSIFDNTDYKEWKQNVIFYEVNFYFDKTIEQHLRIYRKISDILAQLGGFFNIIFLIISLVYALINLFKKIIIYWIFFKYENEEDARESQEKYTEFKNINIRNTKNKKNEKNKSNKQNNNKIKKESHSGFNNVWKIRNINLTISNQIDEENEIHENKISIENNLEIIRKKNQDKDDIFEEDLLINNVENQVNNDFNYKNPPIEDKNGKNSNNNNLGNRFFVEHTESQEKLKEEDIDENIQKYNFNFKEFIEKTRDSFKKTFFLIICLVLEINQIKIYIFLWKMEYFKLIKNWS